MNPVNASLPSSGLSEEERHLVREFAEVFAAAQQFPHGTALREMLDKRLATIEIKLGL